ncbi:MAG: hypothetical protein JNM17_21690 [Archangium sp.]|nr:hypothetical protein [Archangium sp.]
MIVFNLWAIPVGLLIGLGYVGLEKLAPGTFGGAHENLTIAVLSIVIGGLGEVFGLKARVFFMPVWLLGSFVGAYQSYSLWGGAGLALGVGVVVGLIVLFIATIVWSSRGEVEKIPERLKEAREAFAKGENDAGREALADAYVTPFGKLTGDHARKLMPVIEFIEQERTRLGVDPTWTATLAETKRLLVLTDQHGPYGMLSDEQMIISAIEPWLRDAGKRPSDEVIEKLTKGTAPAA